MASAYDFKASNNRRIFMLSAVFVVLVLVAAWWVSYAFALGAFVSDPLNGEESYTAKVRHTLINHVIDNAVDGRMDAYFLPDAVALKTKARGLANRVTLVVFLLGIFWVLKGYKYGEWLVLNAAHAVRLNEPEHRELYRLATTACKTAGVAAPRLYVIMDESLNAFTAGADPQRPAIVVTSGLLEKLSKQELEAVLSHEAAHIQFGDVKLIMTGLVTSLLFVLMGEACFASIVLNRKAGLLGFLASGIAGIFCWIIGIIVCPLMNLAVSRECELRADAQAVLLCRNTGALISALEKIAKDSRVEILDLHPSMVGLCIASPRAQSSLLLELSGLAATHPPMTMRIAALKEMDGRA
mgnify:FL=1